MILTLLSSAVPLLAAALAVVVGVEPQRQAHADLAHGVQGGGQFCSPHPLPLSLRLGPVPRAQTHRPVNQVKHQEHDREHNEEHVIHFGSRNKD